MAICTFFQDFVKHACQAASREHPQKSTPVLLSHAMVVSL